jgi:hypothetical protein
LSAEQIKGFHVKEKWSNVAAYWKDGTDFLGIKLEL